MKNGVKCDFFADASKLRYTYDMNQEPAKKRGRPKGDNPYRFTVSVKLTRSELDAIDSRRRALSRSAWVRHAIRGALGRD